MQSLWSLAAQAPLCSCRACAHVPHGVISRTTAAVLDACYKDGRWNKLDRKIESDRRSLSQRREFHSLVRREDVDVEPRTLPMRHTPLGAIEALNSICKMDYTLDRHVASNKNLYDFLRTIHRTYDPEEKLGNRYAEYLGPGLKATDEAVQEEAQAEDSGMRQPLTNAQFEKYHDMINRLVDKLIIQSYYDEIPWDLEKAQRNLESLDSAWTAIRMLRSEGYPRYSHPGIDPTAAREQQNKLISMIRVLFDDWNVDKRKSKPKFQVAKICYNLLVSPFPPSIYHYNLLLIGFIRKSHHNLTDIVVESLLEDSRLRPTTQTVVCLLLHYRRKRDIHGFYNVIRRMMAIDNRGMLIRRKWYEDVLKFPILRPWARLPEVTTSLKLNWVIERPTRNQDIYEALVSGLLSFGRVKDAAKVFVASLQERMGTSVELFIYLLKQCLYKVDAPAAEILLRGLIDNAGVTVSLLIRDNCPTKLAEHLYPILNMGKPPCWPLSKERATMVWYSRTMGPMPGELGKIRLLTTAMFIRQTHNHLRRLNEVYRRMRHILHVEHPEARTEIVVHGINELNELMRHYQYLAGKLLKHQALLKMAKTLERITWDLGPGKVKSIYYRLVPLLEKTLPRPAKDGGYEKTERLEEISRIADGWIKYRVSRMQGIRSDAKRLMIEAELALLMGHRLRNDIWRLMPDDLVTWRPLDLSMTDANSEQERKDGGQRPDEVDLWPREAAAVVWATGPPVRVG